MESKGIGQTSAEVWFKATTATTVTKTTKVTAARSSKESATTAGSLDTRSKTAGFLKKMKTRTRSCKI